MGIGIHELRVQNAKNQSKLKIVVKLSRIPKGYKKTSLKNSCELCKLWILSWDNMLHYQYPSSYLTLSGFDSCESENSKFTTLTRWSHLWDTWSKAATLQWISGTGWRHFFIYLGSWYHTDKDSAVKMAIRNCCSWLGQDIYRRNDPTKIQSKKLVQTNRCRCEIEAANTIFPSVQDSHRTDIKHLVN